MKFNAIARLSVDAYPVSTHLCAQGFPSLGAVMSIPSFNTDSQ